ncbi:carboxylesterase family protein [Flavobacterium capsici]|uniref:Dienelactone hydrolase family protein n=1 Tax=Flavobacterium capsici TaxID=3075618 RepID=A0AA96EZ88_9FLAO|nr:MULTISPECIES: dienelactone hydrolase family protein [unclassified Flavobacterium]WNM19772.1 dienelactone hydrolase family protein [Flavobacterium sp. PMR2A8]WNM21161.1 dienelactone hydrolase family protein [Flavobacterium sp. PMTSA4]
MRKYWIVFLFLGYVGFSQLKVVKGKTDYPFWINVPEKEEAQPLLIFLHGKSLSGTDINRVRRYGVLYAMDRGKTIPAIVVAPQLASGSWNPDKVLEVLEYVKANYKVDTKRIYVCGMSLGGYGTMHFAGKYPEKITAAVEICGGGNTADGCRLATIPTWLIHGDKDFIVKMSESEKVYDAIKACNPDADTQFTVIKDGNHGNVERQFHQDAIYDWLFSKVKN